MWRTIIRVLVGLTFLWSPGTPLHAQLQTIDRFESITIGEEPPETCIAHKALHIQTPDNVVNVCRGDGQGWDPPPSGTDSLGTGIRMASDKKEVRTIRWRTQELSGDTTLGNNSLILYVVGDGATTQLPDPNDPETPGYYRIIIKDAGAGSLTLIPFATELINSVNAAPPPITGRRSRYDIWLVDGNWEVEEWSIQGYGDPVTTICAKFGGSTNTSTVNTNTYVAHSLTCHIPEKALKAGSELEVCNGWRLTTGSAGPSLSWDFLADAVSLSGNLTAMTTNNNIAGRDISHCFSLVVAEDPSSSSDVYAIPRGAFPALNSAQDGGAGSITQPVALNTNNQIELIPRTRFHAAGTGTNTIKQLFMTVRMRR